MALQPLFALAYVTLDGAEAAPPVTNAVLVADTDSDDALEVIFGDDPIVFAGALVLPLPGLRADVADPAPAHVPPRVADAADHPPRPA